MIGSPAIAAILISFVRDEIRLRWTVVFLLLWLLGRAGLWQRAYSGGRRQLTVETSKWKTLARAIARVLGPA